MARLNLIVSNQAAFQVPSHCGQKKHTGIHDQVFYSWQADAVDDATQNLRKTLNQQGITAILWQESPIKAAFFDMDSTAIGQETIVELAACAGKGDEVHRITEEAMAGKLDFEEALHKRVATLKGLSTGIFEQVQKRLVINPGLREFSRHAKAQGIALYLVSGGFIPFAQRIAQELGFDGVHANHLDTANDQLTGTVSGTIVDGAEKRNFLETTARLKGFEPWETLVVGDGANDLPMMKLAGIAIGYHPKPLLIDPSHGAIYDSHQTLISVID
ncbi:phosphoserine phosphatase SerB [Pseudobacteriovorax antillogorgiicola]|uniref:Phosphoserine phosphatase n=2 Tax=Pseudobacteriovorax antillogorgiicola TaxID=1513793 RepID=A0A1Y6BJA7_9BACT|nr:phosphoserine phosphatase SerB [Pseudobacteriovorax antillogorgiicola]TCS55321.1 phosphoserine phosphatase SerB [Pseudobacteriovorax antillogorgiicola]SMF14174.1 phosphoserine phosphatase SerB [Pseudobacteriovorax antillogorgiicola]